MLVLSLKPFAFQVYTVEGSSPKPIVEPTETAGRFRSKR